MNTNLTCKDGMLQGGGAFILLPLNIHITTVCYVQSIHIKYEVREFSVLYTHICTLYIVSLFNKKK